MAVIKAEIELVQTVDITDILEDWDKEDLVLHYHGEDDEGYDILRDEVAYAKINVSDVSVRVNNASLREFIKEKFDIDPEGMEDDDIERMLEQRDERDRENGVELVKLLREESSD